MADVDLTELLNSMTTTARGQEDLIKNANVMLAAKIIQAQFPKELQFLKYPAKAKIGETERPEANADYNPATGDITLNKNENRIGQTAYFAPEKGIEGKVQQSSALSTPNVLNLVQTLRHEIMHARSNAKTTEYGDDIKQIMSGKSSSDIKAFRNQLYDALSNSRLPSTDPGSTRDPISEYLATAVPLRSAERLGSLTKNQQEMQGTIKKLEIKFPELKQLTDRWERPELRTIK